MKKVWYVYHNSHDYFMTGNGKLALEEIEKKTSVRIPSQKVNTIIQDGYYKQGEYEAKYEYLK